MRERNDRSFTWSIDRFQESRELTPGPPDSPGDARPRGADQDDLCAGAVELSTEPAIVSKRKRLANAGRRHPRHRRECMLDASVEIPAVNVNQPHHAARATRVYKGAS